jgi:hypothetical protein
VKDFLSKAAAAPQVLAENILLPAHNRKSEDETANLTRITPPDFQSKTRKRPLFAENHASGTP